MNKGAKAPAPILYVEDEEDDVLFVQIAFNASGIDHPLRVVTHGQQAIDYLAGTGAFADRQDHPLPCLVLLDLNLPRKSGFEVLEWIRTQPQFQSLPVIIYTSSNHPPDRERSRNLGANEYLVKPSLHPALIELVRGLQTRWLKSSHGSASG